MITDYILFTSVTLSEKSRPTEGLSCPSADHTGQQEKLCQHLFQKYFQQLSEERLKQQSGDLDESASIRVGSQIIFTQSGRFHRQEKELQLSTEDSFIPPSFWIWFKYRRSTPVKICSSPSSWWRMHFLAWSLVWQQTDRLHDADQFWKVNNIWLIGPDRLCGRSISNAKLRYAPMWKACGINEACTI